MRETPSRVGTGDGQIDPTLAKSFVGRAGGRPSRDNRIRKGRFFDLVRPAPPRTDPGADWNERQEFVAELRRLLARSCIDALEPDLIILDEFQRFRHLLEDPNPDVPMTSGPSRPAFAQPDAKVLMLSATPYKMYTLTDEADDDHYRDFVKTSQFLRPRSSLGIRSGTSPRSRRAMFSAGDGSDPQTWSA